MKTTVKRKGVSLSPFRSAMAILMVAVVGAVSAPRGFGQEFRGSITGRIVDSSGGAVAGAQVSVTNTSTNVTTGTTTNDSGDYTVLYLLPGLYTVTVEARGFKKLVRPGIEVRVGDKLNLELQLEVGAVEETLNVTAETPLLEASSSSAGQVIDERRITQLPLSDGNPFVLSRLAPGVAYTGDLKFSRPFDNAGTSAVVVDGALGGNEFTLDGSPNMASGRRVAFVPPADAVQEFKVVTAGFDAQHGHTAGADINVTTKSGTNTLHGTLYEFIRNDKLSANDFFLNRDGRPRDALRYNRYGGSVGGPVWIPKLYSGRDRTFFFFAYEALKDVFPEPGLFTVPTEAQRNGDFSALLSSGIVIYNPATARREGSRVRRDPFPGNRIPANQISPIAKAYLGFYPQPNRPGDAQGRNNFISANPRTDDFHSETYRFDHTFSDKQRAYFRYTHNNRKEARGNWTGVVNGIRPTGNFLFRINNGGVYDHIYGVSANTILNVRVGFSRFNEPSIRQHEGQFDPASLGFSQSAVAFFGGASYFPRFEMSNFSVLGDSVGGGTTHNIYSVQPTATRLMGAHTLKFGYDFRSYRENGFGPGHQAGRYDFGTNFTRGPLDNSPAAAIGQELASLVLGLPTGGFIDRNASRANQTLFNAFFVQDDWKVSKTLTLNLGIRYEREGGTTERFNRNVRGFDAAASSPIEAAAKAAYAANPIPEVSPSNFNVRGGLLFADQNSRGFWKSDQNNVQPRLGVAYRLGEDGKTVLRGGWAVYSVPFIIDGVVQPGFSQATNIVPTLDNGLTFRANLFNPFPDGVREPPGATLGLATFLGRDIGFLPLERKNGQSQRWEVSLQRELPEYWLVELAYIANRGYDLTTGFDLNPVPRQYLSTKNVRDTDVINFLTANVRNPFQGLIPGTGLNGSTVQRQQLLRPFPHFTAVATQLYDGASSYHSGQLRAERRFVKGYSLLLSYTWSKFLEETTRLNATDADYEKRVHDADITNRVVVSGIWEVPIGRGRRWANSLHGALDAIVGGWQIQGIFQAQSGRPLTLGNLYFAGDLNQLRTKISGKTVDRTFDTSGFYFHDAPVQTNGVDDPAKQRADTRIRLASNIRTLPSRFSWFRGQGLNLWDLSVIKNFSVTERVRFQLRGEFLNAFNHPQFNNPSLDPTSSNFGKITGQANLPRNVQIGLKLVF